MSLQEVKGWIKTKDELEEEISALVDYLTQPGMPGLKGGLTDAEGFPRSDIDIPAIRDARAKLIAKENDVKELTVKIEKGLHSVHAVAKSGAPPQPPRPGETPAAPEAPLGPPFALIDAVTSGSPSDRAGVKVNDKVVAFGSVSARGGVDAPTALKSLAELMRHSENKPLLVIVLRGKDDSTVKLTLVPKKWDGPGLLGCHLMPYSGQ